MQRIDLKDLDAILTRAKEEEWTELALVTSVGESDRSTARRLVLRQRLDHVPDALLAIETLTSLEILGHPIGDAGAARLSTLTGLTSLSLTATAIGDAGIEALGALPALRSLRIDGGNLGVRGLQALARIPVSNDAQFPALNDLTISGLSLEDSSAEKLAEVQSLRALLSVYQPSNTVLKAIASLRNLECLSLHEGTYDDEHAELIGDIKSLKYLDAHDCKLPTGKSLRGLKSLEVLRTYNGLNDAQCRGLSRLPILRELRIDEPNQVTGAGIEAIAKLRSMRNLQLIGVSLDHRGMPAIGTMEWLPKLQIVESGHSQGAEALSGLRDLEEIVIYRTTFGDRGAIAIADLPRLKVAHLGESGIGDAGASDLAGAKGVTELDLHGNLIGEVGCRAVLDAWADPETSAHRRRLNLSGNPGLEQLLPAEVLEQTDAQALIAAWRQFKAAAAEGTLRPLNEAKVLVLGKGNVGKTSLIRYITKGEPRDPREPATEGVRAYERIATERWRAEGSPFTLNIWDFGGQEIYYGTHRHFLAARSLYLLVLDDRTDGPGDAEDWLARIRSHAVEAPVIVVVNKAGEGGPGLRLDEAGLGERFGPIVAFHQTSCDPGNDARIDAVKRLIVDTLGDAARMPDVHRGYPPSWWAVKDALADRARQSHYVAEHDFRKLCEAHGLAEEVDQRALLTTLHNLGTVVAHGLDPNARAVHRETTLLDPNWLTQAIYAILGSALVRDQNGEFTQADLSRVLDPDGYPERLHEQIVALMQDERLGLCLRLPGREERYLLAAALPPSVPAALATGVFRPCRRYRYASLPSDLLPRLMVQMRELIAGGSARWRDGVVLTLHGCHVLVRATPADRRVDVGIEAGGDHADPRRAIERIEDKFAELHDQFGEIGATAFVPLPDAPDEVVEVQVLRGLTARGEKFYRHSRADGLHDFPIATLLEGWREEPTATVVAPPRGWLDRLASWQGNAVVGGVVGGVAILLLLSPVASLAPRLGGALLAGWLFFFALRRLDPELGLMRLMLPLGLAGIPLLLGFGISFQVVVSTEGKPSWLNWQTAPSVLALIVWGAVMIALIWGWVADRRRA